MERSNLNLLLWLVTGRSMNFIGPALNVPVFYATKPDDRVSRIRQLLEVGDRRSDAAVLAVMNALHSVSHAAGLPSDNPSYRGPGSAAVEWPEVRGARPIKGDRPVVLHHIPRTLPVPMNWRIEQDGQTLRLTDDAGRNTRIGRRVSGRRLFPDWPEETGFDFGLEFDQDWTGQPADIHIPPTAWPYKLLADRLEQDPQALETLNEQGLAGDFAQATLPAHRVGLAAAAAARRAAGLTAGIDHSGAHYAVFGTFGSVPGYAREPDDGYLFVYLDLGELLTYNGEPVQIKA